MAITVRQGKPNGYVVLNTSATAAIKLNGSTEAGGLHANAAGETGQSGTIAAVQWSVSGSNTWKITRGAGTGANSTMVILSGSGSHNYQSNNIKLEKSTANETSNVVCTLSGGTGTLLLKLHKVSGE